MSDPQQQGSTSDLPAVVAIAATYVYFLLFDQFALLDLLHRALPVAGTQMAMAAMGVAGLGASLATAAALRRKVGAPVLLRVGFAMAAGTAGAAPLLPVAWLTPAAACAGVATALITVSLAADLRGMLATEQGRGAAFGRRVGLGTGLAYAFCNLPPIFSAPPALRCLTASLVALAGLAAAWRLAPRPAPEAAGHALAHRDLRGLGLASIVLSFLALVWLDSAAFAVIQDTAGLKAETWGGEGAILLLGAVHLIAAWAGGRLIDAGHFRGLLLGAFALFAAALGLLGQGAPGVMRLAGPLYAAAVSLYSVALVAFPSYGTEGQGLLPRAWRAALLFGVAGWLGSALGVGMAQSLHRIPASFLLAALALLAGGAWLAEGPLRLPLGEVHRLTWLGLLAGLAYFGLGAEAVSHQVAGAQPDAARGRRVYIAEGCINCHSQYVRPGTRDEALWGPHRAIDRQRERPPLIGLRRQGPDLSNVGRRLGHAALERQLIAPRSVAAHSSMPSYTHLFAPGDERGPDLVAYLESLQ
jgi:hypothetical protein